MLSCVLEPKVISMDTIIKDSGVDPMRYKQWAELSFEEAVINGYDDIDSNLVAVTIHLPLWLRTEVSNINLDHGISQGRVFTGMVNYGCSLIKPDVKEPIKSMSSAYRTLGSVDNDVIMHLMQDMTISVNGVKSSKRKTLSVPVWCRSLLGSVAASLRMDFSSVVRLSLYTAISRYDNLESHNMITCQTEPNKFRKTLDDHMFVCTTLSDKIEQIQEGANK
jgi:hypothetical protein